jgi:hypothetical protein
MTGSGRSGSSEGRSWDHAGGEDGDAADDVEGVDDGYHYSPPGAAPADLPMEAPAADLTEDEPRRAP